MRHWNDGLETEGQRLEQERIERELVEQELRVARTIQQASLPKEVPTLEGWQMLPTTSPPRRWEETSTTSSISKRHEWE